MVSRRLFPEQVRPESLCYVVVVLTYVRCACVDIESLFVENSSMPEKGFRVLESSTLYECGAECLMNQNCMSINFEKKYKRCHLNTDDSNTSTIIHEEGVIYSDIKYWPKHPVAGGHDETLPPTMNNKHPLKKSKCPLDNDDEQRYWPRFLVLETLDQTSLKLNPFVVSKDVHGIERDEKSIKHLRSGSLFIACNRQQTIDLMSTKMFVGIQITVTSRRTLKSSKGIVRDWDRLFADIKSLIGPCENVSCIPGERCTVNRLQRPQCVEDVQHCGSPPSTGNGSMNHQLQSFGAIASYDCDDGYVYCRHTRNIDCQRDGTWEEASTCEKYIWNETTPSFPIPCKSYNFSLSLNARFIKATRFEVNVASGSNLALHVSSRFDDPIYGRYMVFNKKINGAWGDRIGLKYMPLHVGVPFIMDIVYNGSVLEIYLDESHVQTFDRTVQDMYPTHVFITNDVMLHKLTITPMT